MVAALIGLVVLLVVVVLLSLLAYALAFFGFRLTRSRGGETLHVTRGLLTTRAVSLEMRRLRGVEVTQPIPLRWVRGARLRAVTTGLKSDDRGMSAMLAPPSPVGVVELTAERVLESPGALRTPLRQHGAAARRRRWGRAFGASALVAAALVVLTWSLSSWWWLLLAVLVLMVAWPLAVSRSAALGHAVTDRFVVGRSGAVRRSTFVLERGGVVAHDDAAVALPAPGGRVLGDARDRCRQRLLPDPRRHHRPGGRAGRRGERRSVAPVRRTGGRPLTAWAFCGVGGCRFPRARRTAGPQTQLGNHIRHCQCVCGMTWAVQTGQKKTNSPVTRIT